MKVPCSKRVVKSLFFVMIEQNEFMDIRTGEMYC